MLLPLCFLLAFLVGAALARGNLIQGPPFRLHPHVRVAREHSARDVARDAHDHLIAGARLGELRDQRVAVVVPPASAKPVDPICRAGGNTDPTYAAGGVPAPVRRRRACGATGRERGPILAGQRPAADGKVRCFVVEKLRPSGRRKWAVWWAVLRRRKPGAGTDQGPTSWVRGGFWDLAPIPVARVCTDLDPDGLN